MPRATKRTVVQIGNFKVPWSTETHLALSLEALGVDVIRVQENECQWKTVPGQAKRAKADFVMWTHSHGWAGQEFHDDQDEMLDMLRDVEIPSVSYHLDRWWGLHRQVEMNVPYFATDLVCTADGGHQDEFASIGINHIWFPPGIVHTEVGRGSMQSRYRKDVGFIGSWMYYHDEWPERFAMVSHLHRRYGSHFRAWPRGGQPVRGQNLADLMASVKVIAGDSCLFGGITHYSSDRIPETLGRGGFLVHPRVVGVTDGSLFTEGEHLACFDVGNLDELDDVIDRYVKDDAERERITTAAIEHVREKHTYKVRMARLIECVEAL